MVVISMASIVGREQQYYTTNNMGDGYDGTLMDTMKNDGYMVFSVMLMFKAIKVMRHEWMTQKGSGSN